MKHDGNLEITKSGTYEFTEISGNLIVKEGADASLPALTSVGGYLSVYGSAKLDALTSVGGNLYVHAGAKLDATALTSVGGYLDVYGSVKLPKNIKSNDTGMVAALRARISLSVRMSFEANGFLFADGILGKTLGVKEIGGNKVYTIAVKAGMKTAYCVQRGETFSHGDTVEKAIESLRYKLVDHDTERFKQWKPETEITAEDAIQAYRAITGACEYGVREFCESIKVPDKLTVKEAIKLTTGKYGNDKFKEFGWAR